MGLKVVSLTKTYQSVDNPKHLALNDVTFEIQRGTFLTLLGPSGCGKSTLLNMIAGLDRPTSGQISIDSRKVYESGTGLFTPPSARRISMVFQSYAIWPHMTVRQNVEFPLKYGTGRNGGRSQLEAEALRAIEKVHLAQYADRPAPMLSGGQQQRVALARALAQKPSVLLLDEPLSNLDANLREEMQKEIRSIVSGEGVTAVYVTHDQKEALSMSDVVAVMREGQIEQFGTPHEVYFRPVNAFVAKFVGASNLIDAQVAEIDSVSGNLVADCALGKVYVKANGAHPLLGAKITLVLKSEDLVLLPKGADCSQRTNVFALPITRQVFYGDRLEILCTAGRDSLSLQANARNTMVGGMARFSCPPEAIHYF